MEPKSDEAEKKHVLYYDLIKIVAAFMVCFYHLGLLDVGNVSENFYIPNFNKLILNLCAMSVPLFFMVNGALMLRRSYSLKEIIFRVAKITFLYYFWVVAFGEIGALFFHIERLPLPAVLIGERTTLSVHLWFLRTIAILTILIPVIKKAYDQKSRILLYGLMMCVLIFPFLYNYFVLFVRWFGVEGFADLSVTGVFTLYSVLYFVLGKIISDISVNQTGKCTGFKIFAVISIILGWLMVSIEVTLWSNMLGIVYDGVNSSFPTLGALFMAAGVFYLFSRIDVKLSSRMIRRIRAFSANMMGVYIFHMIFVGIIAKFTHSTVSVLITCIIAFIIMLAAALLTRILKKIPVFKDFLVI